MSTSAIRVLIAGGGIGGLAAALSLSQIGARVSVFEKRADPNEDGAGIQIGPNGTRILERLGVAERLRPLVAEPDFLHVHDGLTGERLADIPLGRWLEARHGASYWVIHRADLHNALLEAAETHPHIELHRGQEVGEARSYRDEVLAVGDAGILGAGNVLIAADGIHSALRQRVFGTPPPVYSGKSAARSVIAIDQAPEEIPRSGVGIWLAPQGHVVHYPVRGGRELAIVVIRRDPHSDPDWARVVAPAWVAEAVSGFAPPVQNLVAASGDWRKWALFELAPLRNWVQDRIVLLGDAAHPVFPFLAQGAVLALEDAITLARCVSSSGDRIGQALSRYEEKRKARAGRVQKASRRNGEIYHMSGPLRTARNVSLRRLPGGSLLAGYDWLYGWKVED